MPDYKEMYCKMLRASETAINLLIEAQKECEESYMSSPGPELVILSADRKDQEESGE